MTEETNAPVVDAPVVIPVVERSPAGDGELSISAAVNSLKDARYKDAAAAKKPDEEETPAVDDAAAKAADTNEDGTPHEDAAPAEEETTADEPEEKLPPLEAPRSWTKEEQSVFKTLPRPLQETVARREQERDTETRRSQNEAAEAKKTVDKSVSEAKQAQLRYEQALPEVYKILLDQSAGEFGDIKTMDDVSRLAATDFPRYALWDAHQKKLAATQRQIQEAQTRQTAERSQAWNTYAKTEDDLFHEKVPEMRDPKKGDELGKQAVQSLIDLGFKPEELSKAWEGEASLSVRDHRFQMLALKAAKWDAAQAKAKTVSKAKLPAPQKPGASAPRQGAAASALQALEKNFNETGDPKVGAELLRARRAASR